MRRRYIRFFISSTFIDMKVERNLLQELFDEMTPKYERQGWQIETVDLRWGVSTEASYQNKTMQICEKELLRCQQLSPKPNFIVLLGDRYGWVPLPEIIEMSDYRQLHMNLEEKKVFDMWYTLDNNALPDGQYVLGKRFGRYRKKSVWYDEVEMPLSKMFKRNMKRHNSNIRKLFTNQPMFSRGFDMSATEYEVQLGALTVNDARDHVVAYFRHLSNIPEDVQDSFVESDPHKVSQLSDLKKKLQSKLNEKNIYDVDLSYNDYQQSSFCLEFKNHMKERLTVIIEQVIAENSDDTDDENENHLKIAKKEAEGFVGREDELKYIDHYLHDCHSNNTLWIRSTSGAGKTALLAKVADTYNGEFCVVCRFCGRTIDSTTGCSLLRSLWWNLHQIDKSGKCRIIKSPQGFPGESNKPWECIICKLRNFQSEKPVLVIVDAVNQAEEDTNNFSRLAWLDTPLPPSMKVIVSSTDELRFSLTPKYITIYPLNNMGQDSWNMVQEVLSHHRRRLSSAQINQVQRIISKSDKSAIFLEVLAKYLCMVPTIHSLHEIPSTLTGLVGYILDELSKPENHGQLIVERVVALLAADRIGLSQREVLDLLSQDDVFYSQVLSDSTHSLPKSDCRRIPPVLWSRLLSDLQPFLRNITTKAGQVFTFYHSELCQAVAANYLANSGERAKTYYALYKYYRSHIGQRTYTNHALLEVVNCGVEFMRHVKEDNDNLFQQIGREIYHLLTENAPFLVMKSFYHQQALMKDYQQAMSLFSFNDQQTFLSTQKELLCAINMLSIQDDLSFVEFTTLLPREEHFYCYLKNLPFTSPLRKAIERFSDASTIMENTLSDNSFVDEDTFYVIPELGESPCMSADGTHVASLFQNRHQIVITDLRTSYKSKTYNVKQEVLDLFFSDDMRFFALKMEKTILLFDSQEEKTLFEQKKSAKSRISLSADGQYMLLVDNGQVDILNQKGESLTIAEHVLCAMLSPSGRYVWAISEDYILVRLDFHTNEECSLIKLDPSEVIFKPSYGNKDDVQTQAGKIGIVACSDFWCAIPIKTDKDFDELKCVKYFRYNNQNECIYCVVAGKNISFHRNEDAFITDYRYFTEYRINEDGSIKSHSEPLSWEITSPDLSLYLTVGVPFSRIVETQKALRRYVSGVYGKSAGNSGINSISCDYSGNRIWVGSGINPAYDDQKKVLTVFHGKKDVWIPPFNESSYLYVAQVSASPNGSLVAVSSMNNHSSRECELLLCKSDGQALCSFTSGDNPCAAIVFTEDGKFIIAKTKQAWPFSSKKMQFYLLTSKGKVICHKEGEMPYNDIAYFSRNNRYVFFSYCLNETRDLCIDMMTCKTAFTDSVFFRFHKYDPKGMIRVRTKCFVVQPPVGNVFLSIGNENNVYYVNLDSKRIIKFLSSDIGFPMACSPSGRYIYLYDGGRLLLWDWIDQRRTVTLMEHVQWLIPAFDDSHIFVVKDDYMILLYNVVKRQIEQKAFFGRTLYQQVCVQGLVVVNDCCEVALFRPTASLNVNTPALTTFVRHWNLETQKQELPIAICPACGQRIQIPANLKNVLSPAPQDFKEIRSADWDNPLLHNHNCPHCKIKLNYTPYIL